MENNVINEKVRANTKNFNDHLEIVCPKCGYQGIAGIVNSQMAFPLIKKIWFYLIISLVFVLLFTSIFQLVGAKMQLGYGSIIFYPFTIVFIVLKSLIFPLLNLFAIIMLLVTLFLGFKKKVYSTLS